jgi:hypothetical protein
MAIIVLEIFVDSSGNAKVVADDHEAFDNLDGSLAVRKVVLNVEIPEPIEHEEHDVQVPAQTDPTGVVKVTPISA